MAIPVLIMGRSGSGKTYSLKNFQPGEVGIISVEKNRLPFRSDLKCTRIPDFEGVPELSSPAKIHAARYHWIMDVIHGAKAKSIAIDDSQYLLVGELFDRAHEHNYEKFTEMARNFRDLVHFINALEEDKIVYFLHHSEPDSDGRDKVKTVGRMLDEKLCLEGCFDIVIYCQDHIFFTQGNGSSTAKSPEGMFDLQMENDLKRVDTAIRDFYHLDA